MKYLGLVLIAFVFVGAGCNKGEEYVSFPQTITPTPILPATPTSQTSPAPTSPPSNSNPSMKTYAFPGTLPKDQIENKQIHLSTDKGDIVFELFADTAPMAVSNFVYLAGQGYYDGVIFHRIIEGFMIQGGDPTGTGRSGPGYKFADELNDNRVYDRGIVAMANAGPNTNGSQFFIMHKDYKVGRGPGMLEKNYTIFGRVIEGMDVVDKIALEGDSAIKPKMISVTVEDKK